MPDIALAWNNAIGAGDICVVGADLDSDDGLSTAILLSLFSDRRVRPEELPPGVSWRRGWWGDGLNDDQDQIGSKLWLLHRAKRTPDLLVRARGYVREALPWLVSDGVATAVDVSTAYTPQGWLLIGISITLPDDSRREFQFSDSMGAG